MVWRVYKIIQTHLEWLALHYNKKGFNKGPLKTEVITGNSIQWPAGFKEHLFHHKRACAVSGSWRFALCGF